MLTRCATSLSGLVWRCFCVAAMLLVVGACKGAARPVTAASEPARSELELHQARQQLFEHQETRDLVALVNDAARLVQAGGEGAFADLRVPESRWRQGETYIFVLDTDGNMLVHPDPAMEGKNERELKDVNGKPIIRGLIDAATTPGRPEGWYHYQWPVPGEIFPRWKSSYVRLVTVPSGKRYVVGSGVYNDRMERAFVVSMVDEAADKIERQGKSAFALFHDARGPFIAKDAYVFVIDPSGVDLVNPGFPNLEGRNIRDLKDTDGKPLIKEMLDLVQARGSGWADYMWPKPGDSVSTKKSAYVKKARFGEGWLLVGCGVYLADAPRAARDPEAMTAPELMTLVREGAALVAQRGEKAYPELRTKGSKWFRDDTYFFVWTMDGKRVFHAADPTIEGADASDVKDALGRPYGKMLLDVVASPSGEGWVHYMYPRPGEIFPVWKSTFVKRVTLPSGKPHVLGAGVYNMQMDRSFIVDVVDRAAARVAARGRPAFDELRDKKGPFYFMDTYVFVDTPDGVEQVNPAQPSLEGKNLLDLKDAKGKAVAREYIDLAMKSGTGWVEYDWYRPGENTLARKQAYVRKVQSGKDTFIVGSGLYLDERPRGAEPRRPAPPSSRE